MTMIRRCKRMPSAGADRIGARPETTLARRRYQSTGWPRLRRHLSPKVVVPDLGGVTVGASSPRRIGSL